MSRLFSSSRSLVVPSAANGVGRAGLPCGLTLVVRESIEVAKSLHCRRVPATADLPNLASPDQYLIRVSRQTFRTEHLFAPRGYECSAYADINPARWEPRAKFRPGGM